MCIRDSFGTELPLTVTQMLWVNLIMDTFAAMALASIPPSACLLYTSEQAKQHMILLESYRHCQPLHCSGDGQVT